MAYTVIDKGSEYFDTQLFTGTNTSGRTFTGLNFQPDMIWGKQRDSASYNHFIVDVVRGGTKFIATNTTAAEDTASHGQITSWNSDGTTWSDGTNGTYPRLYYNDNGQLGGSGSRVWWQWKANGAGVSNTSGSITSTVSVNQTSGFSIVSYTGNGSSSATVGHGLGVTPAMVIIKTRNTATYNWYVKHKSLASNNNVFLNLTNGTTDVSSQSQGGIGNLNNVNTFSFTGGTVGIETVNKSSDTYIAYCFAEVKGFSKFGSYTGNGSTDGTFVYTGMRPAWVLIKLTTTIGEGVKSWMLFDNKRNTANPENKILYPNTSGAEDTADFLDFTSNGFKLRTADGSVNASGATYIYAAFAENPFCTSKGVPVCAR